VKKIKKCHDLRGGEIFFDSHCTTTRQVSNWSPLFGWCLNAISKPLFAVSRHFHWRKAVIITLHMITIQIGSIMPSIVMWYQKRHTQEWINACVQWCLWKQLGVKWLPGWAETDNPAWNPMTSSWMKQQTWLRIVHYGDWCLYLALEMHR